MKMALSSGDAARAGGYITQEEPLRRFSHARICKQRFIFISAREIPYLEKSIE
jgi:hypothetical protein